MRRIKFRGKRIDNGGWVYGDLVTDGKNSKATFAWIFPEDADEYSFHLLVQIKKESVCQFTGLKDKNGTEIYEGDVFKNDNYEYVVTFKDGCFVLSHTVTALGDWGELKSIHRQDMKELFKYTKLVGNIHDNPQQLNELNK